MTYDFLIKDPHSGIINRCHNCFLSIPIPEYPTQKMWIMFPVDVFNDGYVFNDLQNRSIFTIDCYICRVDIQVGWHTLNYKAV